MADAGDRMQPDLPRKCFCGRAYAVDLTQVRKRSPTSASEIALPALAGCPLAPLMTTASTCDRRDTGSRSGPAGSSQPLPNRRSPSTTAISTVARQRIVLQAIVADYDVAIRMRGEQRARCGRAFPPREHGRAARRASSTGSSPACADRYPYALLAAASLPPYPRVMMPGR